MRQYKSVLLLKVPYCSHSDTLSKDTDFRTRQPFRPVPSLALAVLCAFIDKYKTTDYKLKAIDVNINGYTEPNVPIDTFVYNDIMEKAIRNNEYDVLGLSAMFVFNVKWVEQAVDLSRKYHPGAKIVIGGGYATLFPQRCLKDHAIDDAVIGEGEATFLYLLNLYNDHEDPYFEKKFNVGSYATRRKNGEIIVFKNKNGFIDLADLPAPAWHHLGLGGYFEKSGERSLPVEGSRGCPYRCSYCCTHISWGRNVRYKPVANMLSEMTQARNEYNIKTLHFVDDNLAFSRGWITEFLNKIAKNKNFIRLTASNFSVKHLDKEILNLLVKADMLEFGIAVESGSEEIQKKINKNLDFYKVREIVKMMKNRNMHAHICWMIGFPGETLEQIRKTFDLARELRAHSNQFLIVLPYPGTQLFEEAKSEDLLVFSEYDLDKFDNRKCDYLKSGEWNYAELQKMIYDINIELNFLNNPLLDTEEGMGHMLKFLEDLLLRLPEHIIARILLGYIYGKRNDRDKNVFYYNSAAELLDNKNLAQTFKAYLDWDHAAINDFRGHFKITAIPRTGYSNGYRSHYVQE